VVVVRRATGRNQGDVSADYGISGVISGSAAPAALRHPSDVREPDSTKFSIRVTRTIIRPVFKIILNEANEGFCYLIR
jgi:hypothetical protein